MLIADQVAVGFRTTVGPAWDNCPSSRPRANRYLHLAPGRAITGDPNVVIVSHGESTDTTKEGVVAEASTPRRDFRVLIRRRTGYDSALIVDVQLQVAATGALVWARSFSDEQHADELQNELEHDLDELDGPEFRRKYGVPSNV